MIVSDVGRTTRGSSSLDSGSTSIAAAPSFPVARSRVCVTSATSLANPSMRSEEHTSELQSQSNLVCRLLLEKKKKDHILTVSPLNTDSCPTADPLTRLVPS